MYLLGIDTSVGIYKLWSHAAVKNTTMYFFLRFLSVQEEKESNMSQNKIPIMPLLKPYNFYAFYFSQADFN